MSSESCERCDKDITNSDQYPLCKACLEEMFPPGEPRGERCTARHPNPTATVGGLAAASRCALRQGHKSPHAANNGDMWNDPKPMSSATVSEVAVRDRYKVEAADLIAEIARFLQVSLEGIDTKGLVRGVRETIRKANSDGILEGQRQAKAEWGEAVEESDESRASRVVRILMDDGDMSSGQPDVIEKRLAAEFAELRAVWMREIAPRGYEFRWNTEAVKSFDRELEKHRRNLYAMRESRGISDNMVADAVFFLLALAHQPVPGGVVEIGGSSPEHEYEAGSNGRCVRCGWTSIYHDVRKR